MSQIVRDLSFISRCGARYRSRALEPLGLTARQSVSLLEICHDPGISQDALARRVALDKSNITRQLAGLEENGLVERTTCPKDKRITRLHPTEKALEILPEVRHAAQVWAAYLTEEFTEEELQVMEALVARMKQKALQWMEAD